MIEKEQMKKENLPLRAGKELMKKRKGESGKFNERR
jgi:hypothetical protein